jgi:ABC-type phosphate transport system auxiliary subunit
VLDKVDLQLSEFQAQIRKQRNKVVNLRTQVDNIESQNSRMLQEEQNYKRLYVELKRIQANVKVDNGMQALLVKGEYNDDSLLPGIVQALEALKSSMDPTQSKSKKPLNAKVMELKYMQEMNA